MRAMRGRLGQRRESIAAVFVCCAWHAHAEVLPHPVHLRVERGPESRACPDTARVLASSELLFPTVPIVAVEDARETTIGVAVAIRGVPGGHEATVLVSGARSGERTLVDRDEECRGL